MALRIGDHRKITLSYANQNNQERWGTSYAATVLFTHPLLGSNTHIDELDVDGNPWAKSSFYQDWWSLAEIEYNHYVKSMFWEGREHYGRYEGYNIWAMGINTWGGR
jgi:hypothetical protein